MQQKHIQGRGMKFANEIHTYVFTYKYALYVAYPFLSRARA